MVVKNTDPESDFLAPHLLYHLLALILAATQLFHAMIFLSVKSG